MQLCFSTLVCPNWPLPQIVGAAAAHGITGVDFRGLTQQIDITRHPLFDAEIDATMDLLHRHSLCIPCYNTSVSLVTPAPERWETMLGECQRYAALAQKTRTKFLRIFGGATPKGMTREEALFMAQRHLRQLVKVCSRHQCQVLMETHDDWSASSTVMELVGEFAADDVGVLWDFEHPFRRGESADQTAAALRSHLRHVHIKDSTRNDGKNVPTLLGKGDLPLPELLRALRGVGYDGWICLETEKRWHPIAPEPEESIPQFVSYVRSRWQ